MIAPGEVIEVGQLEDEAGALGFVIQRPNGELITVKGLTLGETKLVAQMLFRSATLSLSMPAGAPP
ncbi:hypothetical protein ACQ4WP_29090 [Janthinobacterium sp. GB4P2]|uniref:hypothetical protein n=1 Tax=Janthinobacterium sp. GB4P2 TaxID=3424189 RepID=UPI003F27EDDD